MNTFPVYVLLFGLLWRHAWGIQYNTVPVFYVEVNSWLSPNYINSSNRSYAFTFCRQPFTHRSFYMQ